MEYGLQLYSVRDVTPQDMEGALKRVAEMGYRFVEFAGFFGHSAQAIREMLDRYGLQVSGTHSGFAELEQDFAGTVAYHKTLGNTNYIIPGAPCGTREELDDTIAKMNKFCPLLAAEGITLHFHNHHMEFLPNADGLIPHEEMERRTGIHFQIDTYWAFVAGKDPVEVITRLKDRVSVIHLKDGTADGHGYALGEGQAPVLAVRQRAAELGMTMVVESETLQPDGLTEVGRCIRYLKSLEA